MHTRDGGSQYSITGRVCMVCPQSLVGPALNAARSILSAGRIMRFRSAVSSGGAPR